MASQDTPSLHWRTGGLTESVPKVYCSHASDMLIPTGSFSDTFLMIGYSHFGSHRHVHATHNPQLYIFTAIITIQGMRNSLLEPGGGGGGLKNVNITKHYLNERHWRAIKPSVHITLRR